MQQRRRRIFHIASHVFALASTVLFVQIVCLALLLPSSYGRFAVYYKDGNLRQARGWEEWFMLRDLLPQGPNPCISSFELRWTNLNIVVGRRGESLRWAFTTKYSVLFLAFSLFPAWWYGRLLQEYLRQRLGSWRSRRAGLCPHCGYDLRATPDRCPECGVSPAAQPPTHNANQR